MIRVRTFAPIAATLAIASLALTGCGTTTVDAANGAVAAPTSESCAADTTTTSTGPVSFTDGVGRQIELDKPAERIAVLEWQQIEDTLTLCVSPVAVSDSEGYGTYVSAVAMGSAPSVSPPTASTSAVPSPASSRASSMTCPMSGAARWCRVTRRRST